MPDFRIYYDGGSTFDGDPYNAPGWGAVTIVERDADHGRRLVDGKDFFIWRDGRWWAVDQWGLMDYLADPGPRKILIGRYVPNGRWTLLRQRAEADPDFPARTAWGPYEVPVE